MKGKPRAWRRGASSKVGKRFSGGKEDHMLLRRGSNIEAQITSDRSNRNGEGNFGLGIRSALLAQDGSNFPEFTIRNTRRYQRLRVLK